MLFVFCFPCFQYTAFIPKWQEKSLLFLYLRVFGFFYFYAIGKLFIYHFVFACGGFWFDVIAFPKNSFAVSPMDDCPSEVDQKQLDELRLTIRKE